MEFVKNVINYADTKRQQYRGRHGGFVYRFAKTHEGQTLVVIAEIKRAEAWLVSCFYE